MHGKDADNGDAVQRVIGLVEEGRLTGGDGSSNVWSSIGGGRSGSRRSSQRGGHRVKSGEKFNTEKIY